MNPLTKHLYAISISTLALLSSVSLAQTGHEGHNHEPESVHGDASQLNHVEVQNRREGAPEGTGGPTALSVLLFKETTVSTGEILDTEPAHLAFEFKNTGAETLEIQLVKPSCGCTVPEMEKKSYEPGESGTLKVTFDPSGKKGAISRNITIYTNSSAKPVHTVFVHSFVKPVIITRPRILAFDVTRKGQSQTQDIDIFGRFPEFEVTRATIQTPENFSIEVIDGGEVELDGETLWLQTLRVTVLESAKPDNHRSEITVRTNEEHKPILTLAVVARVIGDLELTPVRMTIGRLTVGDTFEREITVKSHSGDAFEISSVNASNIAIEAEYSAKPVDEKIRNEWIVSVKGTVVNPAQRFNAELNILTDVVDEEILKVQMYGQLQPAAMP